MQPLDTRSHIRGSRLTAVCRGSTDAAQPLCVAPPLKKLNIYRIKVITSLSLKNAQNLKLIKNVYFSN